MVIDSSAVLAIVLKEPEAKKIAEAIAADAVRLLSAGTLLEASIAIERRVGETGGREVDALIYRAEVTIVPFTGGQADLARAAYRKYGKGRHRAGLNFGDCISYALAKETGEPLLFKGDDFAHTDLKAVEY